MMTVEEVEYAIRLVDLTLVQLSDGSQGDARNTLRSLRRLLTGPPELLRRKVVDGEPPPA